MDALVGSIGSFQSIQYESSFTRLTHTEESDGGKITDVLEFGSTSLTFTQSTNIVLERAYDKLRGIVDGARADLGIPEGAQIDTSAEATAGRIIDFALGAFEAFQKNHNELGGEDARRAFADFIGAAIHQGISEAQEILGVLNALNPEVDAKIGDISSIITQRLEAFVVGQ